MKSQLVAPVKMILVKNNNGVAGGGQAYREEIKDTIAQIGKEQYYNFQRKSHQNNNNMSSLQRFNNTVNIDNITNSGQNLQINGIKERQIAEKRVISNNVWNKIKSISFNYQAMMNGSAAEAAE